MEIPEIPVPAISIKNLTKRFGATLALDNLSFEIPTGVIAGFVGPNGSGKTTTMRVLATLLKQDSGSAQVFGNETTSPQGSKVVRHRIGFMPDYFGLYTDMTSGQYLEFFAAAYRIPKEKRAQLVGDMLALVNLTDKKETLVSGLSRGMQQKLSLSRSLIHSPDLLLLDEPASGLDPRARIELMELLRELRNMGKTIFISSHILSELQNLCDLVVIMERGRNVFTGTIESASHGLQESMRFLQVTVERDPDGAAELIKKFPGVKAIRRKEHVIFVEHDVAMKCSDIIAACVAGGVMIEDARRVNANLEEIFMQMTGGQQQ